jgi:hypothetical protein
MEVNALLEIVRLLHFVANAAVTFDLVNGYIGGEVIGNKHVLASAIDAGMDRSLSQLYRIAVKRQLTQWRDPECHQIVLVGRISGHWRYPNAARTCRYV